MSLVEPSCGIGPTVEGSQGLVKFWLDHRT